MPGALRRAGCRASRSIRCSRHADAARGAQPRRLHAPRRGDPGLPDRGRLSGHEEARLIYQGVSHLLPQSDERRLVIDIGGRSTEVILGQGWRASQMESTRLGSVAWLDALFPARTDHAAVAADGRDRAAKRCSTRRSTPIRPAAGTRPTAARVMVGAVAEILTPNGFPPGKITREGPDWLTEKPLRAGHPDHLRLEGSRTIAAPSSAAASVPRDLRPVQARLPEQGCEGALRQGALYDLVDRENDSTDVENAPCAGWPSATA